MAAPMVTNTFEDLGNLVRKARLDFGAEIKFMDETELPRWLPTKLVQQQFGRSINCVEEIGKRSR